ncbi:PepSY-associated TM helix domain-containing protein [Paraflavitalea speifideaquila]|uniref:PepSY-associated TM helix domain-containing protein n=1 Tax=Paraflavitalea speifideaquila TaxID=3076558 RepID=UPI0028EE41F6|nr:PepSY-associated TM helix domain-containing protein [Paraflavitalea speifideiaquila]
MPKLKVSITLFPDTAKAASAIAITIYPTAGKYYDTRSFSFDQHTGQLLKGNKLYAEGYEAAGFGAKLRRLNYDIHVGSILGFPGKVIAFFAALTGASLPITGFLVWRGKRKKKTKKTTIHQTQKSNHASLRPVAPAAKTI